MLELVKKSEHWAAAELAGSPQSLAFNSVLAYAAVSRLAGLEMSRIGCIQAAIPIDLAPLSEKNDTVVISAADVAQSAANGTADGAGAQGGLLDAVFSVGWLSSIPDAQLAATIEASVRLVRQGGLVLHTFEIVVENRPSPYWTNRFETIASTLAGDALSPLGDVMPQLSFSCDAASLPDSELFNRRAKAPALDALRMRSQTVGIVFAGRRL